MNQTPPSQPTEREEPAEVLESSCNTATATALDVKEDMASEIGRAIARALQAQTRTRYDAPRGVCPTFSGLEHESPTEFLIKVREYADQIELIEDGEVLNLITKQLRGDASKWFAPFSTYIKTCAEFEARFKGKYDDISTRARLQAKLYSEVQRDNENVSLFILKKRALFHRLEPQANDSSIIPIVTELMRSPIRAYLRTQHFYLLDELDTAASRIDEDLRSSISIPRRPPPLNNNPPRFSAPVSTPPPRANDAVRAPNSIRIAPAATGPRPTTSAAATAKTTIPPTPCRYCGGWHYNNRCPQNPVRPPQGNAQRAGGQITTITPAQ